MQGQERDKNQLSWVPVSHWKKLSGEGGEKMNENGEEQHRGAPSKVGQRVETKQIKKTNRRGNEHSLMLYYELLDAGPGLSLSWPGDLEGLRKGLNMCGVPTA